MHAAAVTACVATSRLQWTSAAVQDAAVGGQPQRQTICPATFRYGAAIGFEETTPLGVGGAGGVVEGDGLMFRR